MSKPRGYKPTFSVEDHKKDGECYVDYVIRVGKYHVKFDVLWWDEIAEAIDEGHDAVVERRERCGIITSSGVVPEPGTSDDLSDSYHRSSGK